MPGEPRANRSRISFHQVSRARGAGDAGARLVNLPGGMESEHRVRGRADLLAWHQAEHHGAGRIAFAIDDDGLAGPAHLLESGDVTLHHAADVAADQNGRGSGCHCQRRRQRSEGKDIRSHGVFPGGGPYASKSCANTGHRRVAPAIWDYTTFYGRGIAVKTGASQRTGFQAEA